MATAKTVQLQESCMKLATPLEAPKWQSTPETNSTVRQCIQEHAMSSQQQSTKGRRIREQRQAPLRDCGNGRDANCSDHKVMKE